MKLLVSCSASSGGNTTDGVIVAGSNQVLVRVISSDGRVRPREVLERVVGRHCVSIPPQETLAVSDSFRPLGLKSFPLDFQTRLGQVVGFPSETNLTGVL